MINIIVTNYKENSSKIHENKFFIYNDNDKITVDEVNKILTSHDDDILLTFKDDLLTENQIKKIHKTLYMAEYHGAVSPLIYSKYNFYQSFPANIDSTTYEDACSILNDNKKFIPDYELSPFANPLCVIIKKSVLKLLAPIKFINSYEESIIKWLEYINNFGYSSITDNSILINCENYSRQINIMYADKNCYLNMHPAKKFAHLHHNNTKPKILVSLLQLDPTYNGTSVHAISLLRNFIKQYSDKYDIHILTTKENCNFFNINNLSQCVVFTDTISDIYHLGITFTQVYSSGNMILLNKHCMKIIISVLDLISYRNMTLNKINPMKIFESSIIYSDAVITISNSVKNDLLSIFPQNSYTIPEIHPVLLGIPDKAVENIENKDLNYILVLGNGYKHKAIDNIIPAIANINKKFIIIGKKFPKKYKNIVSYDSGDLPHDMVNKLFAECSAVLFPSEYEGFGFPVVEGLMYNKTVILRNNTINKELQKSFNPSSSHFIFFNEYKELTSIINHENFAKQNLDISIKTYKEVAHDIEKIIQKTLTQKSSYELINRRNMIFSVLEENIVFNNKIRTKIKKFIRKYLPYNVVKIYKKTYEKISALSNK